MKISIIGAGNMAYQLGNSLHSVGHEIVQIYNRNDKRGRALASKLEAEFVNKMTDLDQHVNLIVIAVSDDAIIPISKSLSRDDWSNTIIAHTSGSIPSLALSDHELFGVFYPFQSMTIGQELNFKQVPILVHSDNEECINRLAELAESISDRVHKVSDEQRGVIHVAGVFANNFSNHMMALAVEVLSKNQLPSSIIKPLIENTLRKILDMDPLRAQTGPAVRGDRDVMDRHLDFLSDQPKLKELYQLVSESIIDLRESQRHT